MSAGDSDWIQDRLAIFHILVVFLDTVHARVSSEDNSMPRIPVGCPAMLVVETWSDATTDAFSVLYEKRTITTTMGENNYVGGLTQVSLDSFRQNED